MPIYWTKYSIHLRFSTWSIERTQFHVFWWWSDMFIVFGCWEKSINIWRYSCIFASTHCTYLQKIRFDPISCFVGYKTLQLPSLVSLEGNASVQQGLRSFLIEWVRVTKTHFLIQLITLHLIASLSIQVLNWLQVFDMVYREDSIPQLLVVVWYEKRFWLLRKLH